MTSQKVEFEGHAGTLAARLDLPDRAHLATALFAHCFTCGKDIHAARRIASRLNALGIAVLRFDFTGLGHSSGEFGNTDFTSNVLDLKHAAAYLEDQAMPASLLIGHSLGGAAILKAAPDIESAKAVVTLGAPFDPGHVLHNFEGSLEQIKSKGSANVELGGRPVTISQGFVDDVSKASLSDALAELKAALLVLHAPRDATVGIENAAEIFLAAKHPKSFVTLDETDHLISKAEDAEYAADIIASWAQRYIDVAQAPHPELPEGIVRSSEVSPDGFLQDITHGSDHHILADEPRSVGGTNRGLTPYGLVSAGLAACTSMTLRMYARRKKWPLEKVHVDVSHRKSHLEDAQSASDSQVDIWHRDITILGPLGEAERAKLLEIADKCPVHKSLERSARVETSLK